MRKRHSFLYRARQIRKVCCPKILIPEAVYLSLLFIVIYFPNLNVRHSVYNSQLLESVLRALRKSFNGRAI
jgi:hypothetical protein